MTQVTWKKFRILSTGVDQTYVYMTFWKSVRCSTIALQGSYALYLCVLVNKLFQHFSGDSHTKFRPNKSQSYRELKTLIALNCQAVSSHHLSCVLMRSNLNLIKLFLRVIKSFLLFGPNILWQLKKTYTLQLSPLTLSFPHLAQDYSSVKLHS